MRYGGGVSYLLSHFFRQVGRLKIKYKILPQPLGKPAFTLAEVLITLAIIGIVATMTIPALVTQNQQKGWETSSKVFEQSFEEALRVMNTQHILAGYGTTEDFVEELKKHFSIIKTCKNDKLEECFAEKITQIVMNLDTMHQDAEVELNTLEMKTSKDLGFEAWGTNTVGIMSNSGVSALIVYNPACKEDPYNNQFVGTNCVALIYDVNGFSTPNQSGKDLRQYGNVKSSEVAFRLNGKNFSMAFSPYSVSYNECVEMKNSGKYGAVGCFASKDYWAGAVQQCGGINKLPTIADLQKIAQILYPGLEIKTSGMGQVTSSCEEGVSCRNANALTQIKETLGIADDNFYLFSNVQDSTPRAVFRGYEENNTYQMNNIAAVTKGWSHIKTMCVQ